MFPDLFMPGFVSSAAGALVPPGGTGPISISGPITFDADVFKSCAFIVSDNAGNTQRISLAPIADGAGTTYYSMAITASGAVQWTMDITNSSATSKVTPSIRVSTLAAAGAGAWSSAYYQPLAENGFIATSISVPAGTCYIGFSSTNGGGKGVKFDFKFASPNNQVLCAPGTSIGPAFARYIVDTGIVYGRVLSMSILATNTSDSNHNGGNINAGRVPNSFDPFSDPVAQLSVLPSNRRYQGPAATGAYVTWIPSQLDEFSIDGLSQKREQLNESEYLYLKVDGWPAGAVFKLQFDWIVEFYTPAQAFEKVYPPPITDEFRLLYYYWALHPAAMCNPVHESDWKTFAKSVVGKLSQARDFYKRHEGTIDALGSIASSLLL